MSYPPSAALARRLLASVILVGCALIAVACVGAIERTELQQEVDGRGGGVLVDAVAQALDSVRDEMGASNTDEIQVTNFSYNPNHALTLLAVPVGMPEALDTVTVLLDTGEVVSRPVQNTAAARNDRFALGEVAFGNLEQIADDAIDALGTDGAHVASVQVTSPPPALVPIIRVTVESERDTALVLFDAAGSLLEVQR